MEQNSKFEEYYKDYRDMVHTLCLGYAKGDKDIASDLFQEVFIKVWGGLPTFEARSTPKTWIYRICVNTCLLYIRKSKNTRSTSLDDIHLEIRQEHSEEKNYSELYKAIGQLREVDRIVVMLVLDSVPYNDISEITGISEGNVRVRISRAKQKLNKILSNNG